MTTHRQDSPRGQRRERTPLSTLLADGGERQTADPDEEGGDGAADTQAVDREAEADSADFPRPPLAFTDGEGREIEIRAYDGEPDPLIEMYEHFEPEDRAQGIPPRSESRLESWLETLLDEGLTVLAWHGDQAVGHSVLIPMEGTKYELAIFVRSDYQLAGIGGKLIRCLLGHGQANGVETVWLSVQYHNNVAINLYKGVGFHQLSGGQEYKMEREI